MRGGRLCRFAAVAAGFAAGADPGCPLPRTLIQGQRGRRCSVISMSKPTPDPAIPPTRASPTTSGTAEFQPSTHVEVRRSALSAPTPAPCASFSKTRVFAPSSKPDGVQSPTSDPSIIAYANTGSSTYQ